jgi:DNA-binding phage protein
MSPTARSVTTNTQAANVVGMLNLAMGSNDPIKRAQILAEAQPQLAFALRSAVEECLDAQRPLAQIADWIGLPRETLHRQLNGGGPVVTVRAERGKAEVSADSQPRMAVYAFQDESDQWWGEPTLLPPEEFITAMLPFSPVNTGNRFANQVLRVRVGPVQDDVSFSSAQVRLADGSERRVLVTYIVINLLFEDGQSPLRRAVVQVINAVLSNRKIPQEFRDLVHRADFTLVETAPEVGTMETAEFIEAVRAVVAATESFKKSFDPYSSLALNRLRQVVSDYERWSRAA